MAAQAEIRPFVTADVGAVAELLRAHLGSPVADLERFLRATLLDDPWSDPELPSLVAEDGGALVGFIARQPRRLELDGEPLRAVVCSHLTVEPGHRAAALALRLARACLNGPQRLTYSDSGGDVVVRLWRVLGGDVDTARAGEWMLVLRPARWAAGVGAALARSGELPPDVSPVGAVPLHVLWRRSRARELAPEPGVRSQPADAAALAGLLEELEPGARLRPVADAAHLGHVLATIGDADARIVSRDGHPIGLWVGRRRPGGACQVLALAARGPQDGRAVLADLATAAHGWGATALGGRLEPHMRDAVRPRGPALALMRLPLLHTRDDAVRAALASTASLLPKLETEWWVP